MALNMNNNKLENLRLALMREILIKFVWKRKQEDLMQFVLLFRFVAIYVDVMTCQVTLYSNVINNTHSVKFLI